MSDQQKEVAEKKILGTLDSIGGIQSSNATAAEFGVPVEVMESVLRSLLADEYIVWQQSNSTTWMLTDEASGYAEKGMPEVQLYHAIPEEGLPLGDVKALCDQLGIEMKVAQGALMKNKWATADKKAQPPIMKRAVAPDAVVDATKAVLVEVRDTGAEPADSKGLLKRKLVKKQDTTDYTVLQGPKFALERKKASTDITAAMMQAGTWETESFKDYNMDSLGTPPEGGTLHPLLKVRKEFREVFLELGFEEMPTSKWVESSFWNFDALFQPQQHPARDAHDTFFVDSPATTLEIPDEYLNAVWDMHQNGGHGSVGYQYEWSEEETRKNILRTHTTAVSSRMLYQLAQDCKKEGVFTPKKYFSIDRVFRNEALDKTHLAEFHQVEGLICDRGITLGDLIGTIQHFFQKIGIPDVKFKPAYNPYTEPSMEIFGYHPGLGKWVELGNSGMFRPEMLLPMGLPEDVSVIAWGLALERPTMIMYSFPNIRDLFGHGVDLKMIKKNAVCRLDKTDVGKK